MSWYFQQRSIGFEERLATLTKSTTWHSKLLNEGHELKGEFLLLLRLALNPARHLICSNRILP
jgi:hypothetical protein